MGPLDVFLIEPGETDDQAENIVQPDLLVVCDRTKLKPNGIQGAPEFILEILSQSTASRDQIAKAALYERAGVKEYWVLNPADMLVTVRNLPPGGMGPYTTRFIETKGKVAVGAVEGLEFDLESAFIDVLHE